jgi:hypothetical protein
MTDTEMIAASRIETEKVRNWRERPRTAAAKPRYVLLELEAAERLIALAEIAVKAASSVHEP